ncbi:PREDICTED: uncharacterized protein LOC107096234 [Cyprinodon variegatus]|uniref:uncharacterized protein LOC107096234 n=1 Tax=Cyprinodon variegatus TaxID=28743 RepID=UPI00074284CE|nr:PREDICTED: uncharacterized protein LOC107096234 [Cyprinodon variegatus]
MILLLGLLCSIRGEPALGVEEDRGFSLEGDLHQLAVSNESVYISTQEKLYQLSHDLTLINSLNLRGILKNPGQQNGDEFHRVSMNADWNATFIVNVLLPFVKNDTIIICGATDKGCGYCEVLDLRNISKLVYREPIQVGPRRNSRGSVNILVDVKKDSVQTETYILTAIQKDREKQEKTKCPSDLKTINLQNTDQEQSGGIFSLSEEGETPNIQTEAGVDFVDGFQISSTVFLFSNVASGAKTNKVRLIWLQAGTSKAQTLKSLRGATLSSSNGGNGSRLLASSVIPGGEQVFWSGVFSLDGKETNTELLLFDISPDQSKTADTDPDFYYSTNKPVSHSI